MKTLTIRDLTVRYADTGHGEPVILAHCSSASHRMWAALQQRLARRYRVLAPDLIGYGQSDAWPEDEPFHPDADTDVLVRLAERTGQRVHLVGHSYGAAVALEAATQLGDQVRSLTLVEPVSFHLLARAGRDREWCEIAAVADAIQAGIQMGRPWKAAAAYMGFWIGPLRWRLMPRRARERVVSTVAKVAHEFTIMDRAQRDLSTYCALTVPTRLLVGARTRRPARAVVEVVAELLPHAEVLTIPRAGHMSPFTHQEAVHRLLAEHVDQHTGPSLESRMPSVASADSENGLRRSRLHPAGYGAH